MLPTRFTRLIPATRTLSRITRQSVGVRCMGSNVPMKTDEELLAEWNCTMNHMPVPSGSFQENRKKRQTKFNRQLFLSIISCILCTYYMYQAGHLFVYDIADLDEFERFRQARIAREKAEAAAAEASES